VICCVCTSESESAARTGADHVVICCVCTSESLLRGLELMCVCLSFFPPSSQFLPYLQLHLTCPLDSGIMRFTQVTLHPPVSLVTCMCWFTCTMLHSHSVSCCAVSVSLSIHHKSDFCRHVWTKWAFLADRLLSTYSALYLRKFG